MINEAEMRLIEAKANMALDRIKDLDEKFKKMVEYFVKTDILETKLLSLETILDNFKKVYNVKIRNDNASAKILSDCIEQEKEFRAIDRNKIEELEKKVRRFYEVEDSNVDVANEYYRKTDQLEKSMEQFKECIKSNMHDSDFKQRLYTKEVESIEKRVNKLESFQSYCEHLWDKNSKEIDEIISNVRNEELINLEKCSEQEREFRTREQFDKRINEFELTSKRVDEIEKVLICYGFISKHGLHTPSELFRSTRNYPNYDMNKINKESE